MTADRADLDRALDRVAGAWRQARRGVAFTGAGISTESGIPDFRSPGGIWSRFKPVDFSDFVADRAARVEYWQRSQAMWPTLDAAKPNAGHTALARAEGMGHLDAVVTQNIDGLHQKGGSQRVIELHGTAMRVKCIECGAFSSRADVQARLESGDEAPACDVCGGPLKPATISFGQAMPEQEMNAAAALSRDCDFFLVVGSSLVVYPAAALPAMAAQSGATLVIVNRDPTPLDDLATVALRGGAGEMLHQLVERLEGSATGEL